MIFHTPYKRGLLSNQDISLYQFLNRFSTAGVKYFQIICEKSKYKASVLNFIKPLNMVSEQLLW